MSGRLLKRMLGKAGDRGLQRRSSHRPALSDTVFLAGPSAAQCGVEDRGGWEHGAFCMKFNFFLSCQGKSADLDNDMFRSVKTCTQKLVALISPALQPP